MKSDLISTTEAAKMLGCSQRTVQRMIDRGILPGVKMTPGLKSVWLIERKDVGKILKRREAMAERTG